MAKIGHSNVALYQTHTQTHTETVIKHVSRIPYSVACAPNVRRRVYAYNSIKLPEHELHVAMRGE